MGFFVFKVVEKFEFFYIMDGLEKFVFWSEEFKNVVRDLVNYSIIINLSMMKLFF